VFLGLVLVEASDPVAVSGVPGGPAGGVTWMTGSDDQLMGRDRVCAQLVVALAGRAGEELLLDGGFTQGAQSERPIRTAVGRTRDRPGFAQ